MKKRKISLILNICTICLAVVAIVIGVYSLQQAKLNINGSVGFVAHNCKFQISGSVTGANTTDSDSPAIETRILTTKEYNAEGTNTNLSPDYDIGNLYFNDMLENGNVITITLTITNKSTFDVTLNVSAPTYTNGTNTDKITALVQNNNKNFTRASLGAVGTSNASITITITLTVDKSDLSQITTISGTMNLSLTLAKKEDLTVLKADDFYYAVLKDPTDISEGLIPTKISRNYVEMGSYNGEPLRWYVFAKGDVDGNNMASFTQTLDSGSKLESGTYYFISECILENYAFQTSTRTDGLDNGQYNGSDIQQYLVSDTFASEYNLVGDKMYNNIINRDLPAESENNLGIEASVETKNQALWLLSYDETLILEYPNESNCTPCVSWPINADKTNQYSISEWWLRSRAGSSSDGWVVNNRGITRSSQNYLTNSYGIRPAFQIIVD